MDESYWYHEKLNKAKSQVFYVVTWKGELHCRVVWFVSTTCLHLKHAETHCESIVFILTCRTPKCICLSQISGNALLCGYHFMSIHLFPQSISVWTSTKPKEGPHPHQCFTCFDESGLLFWSATTFLGILWCSFRCFSLLRFTYQM